ncbi:MAG: nucleoside-diphosphate kinase [Deltaproteobacteria bacterium]|jgi:nucleoside-diphosphate kinase|nr:nucleoside-diphosphate kinase [Deltaproteobacteria bacterium]MCK5514905.1 nucleoside-diphosphate kinase [Deltaproteobacteria bacterium]
MKAERNNNEQILVLIKPDALLYSLTGFIIERVSAVHNPVIAASKVVRVTKELAEEHYVNIRGKPFYPATLRYIMGELHYPAQPEKRRVVAVVYQGIDIVNKVKGYFGPTKPRDAKRLAREEGVITLRAQLSYTDFSVEREELIDNAVHASENGVEAEREIKLWFEPGDFPGQHRFFDYVESEEFFYYSERSGDGESQILSSREPGSKCIVAPGSLVWETDYENLLAYRDKKGSPSIPLNSIIAKYILKTR